MAIQYYADQNIEGKLTVSTVLRVNDSGSSIKGVGINTMNPGGELQIVGGSTGIGNIYVSANAAGSSVTDSLWIKKQGTKASIINRDGGDLSFGANDVNDYITIKGTGDVGIGTTSPDSKLNIEGAKNTAILTLGNTTQGSSWVVGDRVGGIDFYSADGSGGGIGVKASISYEDALGGSGSSQAMVFRTGGTSAGTNNVERMRLQYNGNVGIGTTSPNSKLQVDGEIDANGGDGYRINGKPWAAESSSNLRLGDWDGEGFTTSIFDDNGAEIVTIENYGTMINCSSLVSSYGSNASLAIGTAGATSAGAAVITLSNNDTTGSAGDATGIIQFAIKDDNAGTLGYTSASIQGSIFEAPGSGNSGGGVLDFKTSLSTSGASPQTRIRINQLGDVGIGTTIPSAKLDVVQATTANGAAALHLIGPSSNPDLTTSVLIIEQSDGKKITMDGNDIDVSSGDLFINDYSGEDVTFGGQIKVKGLGNPVGDSYISNGNFGVGTTSPQEKLHVIEEVEGSTLIEVENTRGNSTAGVKLSSGLTNFNIAYTNANGDFQIYNKASNRILFHIGANESVGIDTVNPTAGTKLDVAGSVKAEKYINQRVAWNVGFNHGSNNTASYYFIPIGYIAESVSDTYYNNWIAPYAGRIKKIVMRNTGQSTVPTATTINFRVSVNGSVVYTGSTITVTGSGLNILASQTLSDTNAVFSATDRVQVAYRTNGLWRNAATGISLEYTE